MLSETPIVSARTTAATAVAASGNATARQSPRTVTRRQATSGPIPMKRTSTIASGVA